MRHSPCTLIPLATLSVTNFPPTGVNNFATINVTDRSVSIAPLVKLDEMSLYVATCCCHQPSKRIQKLATQVKHSASAYGCTWSSAFHRIAICNITAVMPPTKCLGEWSTCDVPFSVSSDRP